MKIPTNYQGSRPCGFRQEDLFMFFSFISLCKADDPRGRVIFGPMEII